MVRFKACTAVLGVVCGTLLAVPASHADFIVANDQESTGSVVNVSAAGVVTANSSPYQEPVGLALSPNGTTLYVVSFTGDSVYSVAAIGGTPTTLIPYSDLLNHPRGIATDSSGNIYIADGSDQRIAEFNSSGSVINANFITGLSNAAGVAIDNSGNVYVTTFTTLERFTSAGGSTPNLTVGGFSMAAHVTLGTGTFAGFAFVSDESANAVYEVNLSTGTMTQFNTSGSSLNYPDGLTFDNNGNLFVVNSGNNTISEITPSGYTSTFATSGIPLSDPVGIVFVPALAATPEPSSLLLSVLGLGLACAYRCWSRWGTAAQLA